MAEWTERVELYKKRRLHLQKKNVLVVGLEAYALRLNFRVRQNDNVDGDVVDITNINRQLPALHLQPATTKITIVGGR
jgi:tRNA A37 threonylcarbamoyladenosine dehydratase